MYVLYFLYLHLNLTDMKKFQYFQSFHKKYFESFRLKKMCLDFPLYYLENLIKIDNGITGNYTNVGAYSFTFPKSYKQVLGVAINVYKTGTATTLENAYLTGFNNTGFSFVKDCVDANRANTVKVAYTVFYV